MHEIANYDDLKNVIKQSINPDMSDAEFIYFFEFCKRRGLDPLTDVYPVSRWDKKLGKNKVVFQCGIDSYRKIATRTGDYASSKIEFCGDDGIWKDVWVSEKPPIAAKCTVIRKSSNMETYRVALFREYVQKFRDKNGNEYVSDFWQRMPCTMIAKCAESLALRATFPEELGDIYTREEMMQADNDRTQKLKSSQVVEVPAIEQEYTAGCNELIANIKFLLTNEEHNIAFDEWLKDRPRNRALLETLSRKYQSLLNQPQPAEDDEPAL